MKIRGAHSKGKSLARPGHSHSIRSYTHLGRGAAGHSKWASVAAVCPEVNSSDVRNGGAGRGGAIFKLIFSPIFFLIDNEIYVDF